MSSSISSTKSALVTTCGLSAPCISAQAPKAWSAWKCVSTMVCTGFVLSLASASASAGPAGA
jgi:hypothetical protein